MRLSRAVRLALLFVVLAGLALAVLWAGGCGDDDDDDDDAGDDDAGDDDAGDDDAGDDDAGDDDAGDDDSGPVFSCDDLTEEELALFSVIFCAGSSNSHSGTMGNPPFTPDRLDWWYHGKILERVWENLGACVEYTPELWVYWYADVSQVPEDTTLSWAVDAFYHYLDDDPSPEVFRQRVSGYLDTLYGTDGMAESVYFIGANIPKIMMLAYSGDKDEILAIIEDELAARPRTAMLDLNYYIEALLDGRLLYDGETVRFLQIMRDLIHANQFGQQLIADLYITEINRIWPNLMVPHWGEVEVLE